MNRSDSERRKLMRKLEELSFVLVETHLYLDTHPTNRAALDYYRSARTEYDRLLAEYEMKYAPVVPGVREGECEWSWVRASWPWELGFPESGEAKAAVPRAADD